MRNQQVDEATTSLSGCVENLDSIPTLIKPRTKLQLARHWCNVSVTCIRNYASFSIIHVAEMGLVALYMPKQNAKKYLHEKYILG